jgi:type IV secretory pathway VirB2 component (pilin)
MHDKFEATKAEIVSAKVLAAESKAVILHVDQHMDNFGNQLATIQTIPTEIGKMVTEVEEMRQQLEPFKRLAVLLSKPVAIAVAIYVVIATIFAVMEGIDQFEQVRKKFSPSDSVTNSVVAKP